MARITMPADAALGYEIKTKLAATRVEFEKRLDEIKANLADMDRRLKAQEEKRGPGRPPKQD